MEIASITSKMNNGKEKSAHDMCKNHTARSEKDIYRICPSKLSKRELEDLYFALVENNVELKKTVNGQREQLKVLSTKLQRVTAQRGTWDPKECCCNCKAVMNEQKETIADLKKTNDRLNERIRLLNMRLCSAKQFLKKGSQAGLRCPKCNTSAVSVKNSSTSALNLKANEENVRSSTASCQYLNNDIAQPSSPTVQTTSTREQPAERACDQNKCRTLLHELKQRIADLQQELSTAHEDYTARINRLEEEMSGLHKENVRVRRESSSSGHRIEQQRGEIADLLQRLRICEAQCEQLAVQLRLEKSRAAELEMRAKAAETSSHIANAIEKHLNNLNMKREEQEKRTEAPESNKILSNVDDSSMYHCHFQLIVPNNSTASQTDKVQEIITDKVNRTSDDSGYTETHRSQDSTEVSPKKETIINQIADLQAQLNSLKQAIGEKAPNAEDTEENELFKSLQSKRKSYCEKIPTTSKNNGSLECQSTSPRDDDYLIRSKRLNSPKTTHEWYTEYDAESTIDGSIKDKSRRSSRYVENKFDIELPKCVQSNVCNKDNINIESNLDVNDSEKEIGDVKTVCREFYVKEGITNGTSKDETVTAVESSTGDFKLTKETITRVNGKSINESCHVKSDSTLDMINKENESFLKPVNESLNINESFMEVTRKKNEPRNSIISDVVTKVKGNKYVSTGVDPSAEYAELARNKEDTGIGTEEEFNRETAVKQNRLDMCEQSVRICTCPISPRRGVAMFRSCSGTLRFSTTASNSKFRRCSCGENKLTRGNSMEMDREEPGPVQSPGAYKPSRRTSTPTRGTYVLQGSARVDALSPDTRCDISSLTDIPSERELTSPSNLSPGEDKGTCTQSDLTPRSTTDYGSLSEGELPVHERRRSVGDTQSLEEGATNIQRHTSTSEKMEEALRAISDELSRCRHLLQVHTSLESTKRPSQGAASTTERDSRSGRGPLALRKCDATERMRGTSPKCVFTLHVGTVILADQAVVSSRNKSLALAWRFYEQAPTLTQQLAGRVMHFDFSVEYDVRLTEQLLYYLKQEEMPIIVCEWDQQDTPFASCTLPLRDALLHTNRRVDMSLALISGPGMRCKDAPGANMSASEESGVLDVWCMLRVPPEVMPVIDDFVSQALASSHRQPSSLERILDADHTDYPLAQDLDLRRSSKSPRTTNTKASYDSENIYDIMNSKKWRRASTLKQTEGYRKKSVTILQKPPRQATLEDLGKLSDDKSQTLDITILWLALNEECKVLTDPTVKRLYVAYSFLGKSGADMETPSSLPKPRNFMDKCHFNFRKSFVINECDVAVLGRMAQCRQDSTSSPDPKDCVVFSIISEPPEDPLGLDTCEDIGYAHLYLGDALWPGGESHTEVLPVRSPDGALVSGRLAVRLDGLAVLRACLLRANQL